MILTIPQNTIVRALVTDTNATVQQAAALFHPTIQPGNHSLVSNASNYTSKGVLGQWISNGKSLSHLSSFGTDFYEWRPVLGFDPSHKVGLYFRAWRDNWYPEKFTPWNGFALVRRGIIGGAINPAYSENHEVNNFLGFGVTASRELVIKWEDGWEQHHLGLPVQGITKTQGFQSMIEAGVIEGGDGGYGGDLVVYRDNQPANVPYNDGFPPRVLPNVLCLELSQIQGQPEPPPVEPPVEPPSSIPPIIETQELDGTRIARYRRVIE